MSEQLGVVYERRIKMPKHPTVKAVPLNSIISNYGATFFHDALAHYIAQARNVDQNLTRAQIEHDIQQITLPFQTLPVFQTIKFTTPDYSSDSRDDIIIDSVHVKPSQHDGHGNVIPACFDTMLVNDGSGGPTGTKGQLILLYFIIHELTVFRLSGWPSLYCVCTSSSGF
jgi:hypothetical protein